MPDTDQKATWPDGTVEAVAKVLARLYNADREDGDNPEAFAEAPQNEQDEWRGDALAILKRAPVLPVEVAEGLATELEAAETFIESVAEWLGNHPDEQAEALAGISSALTTYRNSIEGKEG